MKYSHCPGTGFSSSSSHLLFISITTPMMVVNRVHVRFRLDHRVDEFQLSFRHLYDFFNKPRADLLLRFIDPANTISTFTSKQIAIRTAQS